MKPGELVVCHLPEWKHDKLGVFLADGEKMPEKYDHRRKGIIMTADYGMIETVSFIKAPDIECEKYWSRFQERINETG